MKLSIIGLGVVGKACLKGFKKLGHECLGIDLKNIDDIDKILSSEIIYICLPVPFHNKKILDDKLIEHYLKYLKKNKFKGVIAIKSTIIPGRTKYFRNKFSSLKICFVPEFLRERFALADFVNNHELLIVGTTSKNIFHKIKKSHGNYPKKIIMTKDINAELIKIYSNTYNAYRIMFSNIFFELSKKLNFNYSEILDIYLKRKLSKGYYLKCNNNLRGYAGTCLPKDMNALNLILKKNQIKLNTIETIIKDNNKIKKTVFKGMRFK